MNRKGQFFIITTVLIAGVLLAVLNTYSSTDSIDYSDTLSRHDTDIIRNVGDTLSHTWWNVNWSYRTTATIAETGGVYVDQHVTNVVLSTKRRNVQDNCRDIRVRADGEKVPWIPTTACDIGTYQSDTAAVARYKLDAVSGTTADDATGNGHTGTISGAYDWVSGRFKGGLSLTEDAYAQVDDHPDLDSTDEKTVMGWIRTKGKAGSCCLSNTTVRKYDFGDNRGFMLGRSEDYEIYFAIFEGTITYDGVIREDTPIGNRIDNGEWHHIAGVKDGQNLTLYYDGQRIDRKTTSVSNFANNADMFIGRGLEGDFDDVRVYDQALTDGQIEGIYRNGIGLNLSTTLDPFEHKQYDIYYGNGFAVTPTYDAVTFSNEEPDPAVVSRSAERNQSEIEEKTQKSIKQLSQSVGPNLEYTARQDICDLLTLRSSRAVLQRDLCTSPQDSFDRLAAPQFALVANDSSSSNLHWVVSNYLDDSHEFYNSTNNDLVAEYGPEYGEVFMIAGPYFQINKTYGGKNRVAWENRTVSSPTIMVENPRPTQSWTFDFTEPDGTYTFHMPEVPKAEEDYLIFWEDLYSPFKENSVDDWTDEVVRISFIPPDTYRVARYYSKGGYQHQFYLFLSDKDPLSGDQVLTKAPSDTIDNRTGDDFYEESVYMMSP